jgi:hypothetical protein
LSILQTTLERKNTNRDNSLLSLSLFVVKTPKREKRCEAKMRWQLLIVLRLLIVVGLLLIVIIESMSRANVEGSQLCWSQRGIGDGDGREDRDVGELMEWLVSLAVNNLLVAPHNLQVLLHDIQGWR